MQNKASQRKSEIKDNASTDSCGYTSDEYDHDEEQPIHKMIMHNQLQIKKSLENDIKAKNDLIDNSLKYEMAGTVMKSYLLKKKRILCRKAFKIWSGKLKYSEAVMYHNRLQEIK